MNILKLILARALMCCIIAVPLSVQAADGRLDGRYVFDAKRTEQSEIYQKVIARNPAEAMGLQMLQQLMDTLVISGRTLKGALIECSLKPTEFGMLGDCSDILSKEHTRKEFVLDGDYLVLLNKM